MNYTGRIKILLLILCLCAMCRTSVCADGANKFEFADDFSGYDHSNAKIGEANAVRGTTASGVETVVAHKDGGYWKRSDVSFGWTAQGRLGMTAYINDAAGTLFVNDEGSMDNSFVNLHLDRPDFDMVRITFDMRTDDSGRYGVRFNLSGDERSFYEVSIGGWKDEALQSYPYFKKVVNNNAVYLAKGSAVFSSKVWYSVDISIDKTADMILWTVYKTSDPSVRWGGSYTDAQMLDDNAPAALQLGGSCGWIASSFDNFRYLAGNPFTGVGEPMNILYESIKGDVSGDTVSFDRDYAVRRIEYPPYAGQSVELRFIDKDNAPQAINAVFDANGRFINCETDGKFQSVRFPEPIEAAFFSALTNVGSGDTTDVIKGTTVTFAGRIQGAEDSGNFVWNSDDPYIATVDRGVVTGKRDGNAVISASFNGVTLSTKVRVVGEFTYAQETGRLQDYLADKKPVIDSFNDAAAQGDKEQAEDILLGENGMASIDIIDLEDIMDLRDTKPQMFSDYIERLMTYDRFACSSVGDIYYLRDVLKDEIKTGYMNNLLETDDIKNAIAQYNGTYQLDTENAYYTDDPKAVLTRLLNKKFANLSDLGYCFREAVLLTVVRDCTSFQYAKRLIDDFKEDIGYDPGRFDGIKDKDALYQEFVSKRQTFDKIGGIKTFIDTFTPKKSGGGGGGGSKGSSAGSVTLSPPNKAYDANSLTAAGKIQIYEDVPAEHWAYEGIRFLTAKKTVGGYGDNKFMPDQYVTRAEFLKMLLGGFDWPVPDAGHAKEGEDSPFEDVGVSDWFYPYIKCAADNGILFGGADKKARPNGEVSREEMAVFITRLIDYSERNISYTKEAVVFKDNDSIDFWAVSAVYRLLRGNIINGIGDGLCAPNRKATRAEAAKTIQAALLNSSEKSAGEGQ